MVAPLGRAAYLEQLRALMPRGRAWPRDPDTTFGAFLESLADDLAAIDRDAAALRREFRPSTATDLLPEWEAEVGLPDDCSSLASTIAERRAAILTKLVSQPTLHPDEFIAIAARFGITVTVDEHDQARAAASTAMDTTGGRWRFVWWITIPSSGDVRRFDMLSHVDTPLFSADRNTELECRLRAVAPAHTLLVIGYS